MTINEINEAIESTLKTVKAYENEKPFIVCYFADDEQIWSDFWRTESVEIRTNEKLCTTYDELQWLFESLLESGVEAKKISDLSGTRISINVD